MVIVGTPPMMRFSTSAEPPPVMEYETLRGPEPRSPLRPLEGALPVTGERLQTVEHPLASRRRRSRGTCAEHQHRSQPDHRSHGSPPGTHGLRRSRAPEHWRAEPFAGRISPLAAEAAGDLTPVLRRTAPREICPVAERGTGRPIPRRGDPTARSGTAIRSDVEVERELHRVGPQPHRVHFLLDLEVDPRVDDVVGEDVALEQELVVLARGSPSASSRLPGIFGTSFSSSGDSP